MGDRETSTEAPQSPPQYSSEFPRGYGDFTIQSCDDVLLDFPLFLLSHASPVFKDMFDLGNSGRDHNALTLTEDHETLERLLAHIDPAKDPLDVQWSQITSVLTAADKYQVKGIFKWFEKEVALQVVQSSSFELEHPMLCLDIACRYGLLTVKRLALRQLIKCSISEIRNDSICNQVPFEPLHSLRLARIQRLSAIVTRMAANSFSKKDQRYQCSVHGYGIRNWAEPAITEIMKEPSWAGLIRGLGTRPPSCNCPEPTISLQDKYDILELELVLPDIQTL
jgi:hypothetical protein